jgi:hypothetical protein
MEANGELNVRSTAALDETEAMDICRSQKFLPSCSIEEIGGRAEKAVPACANSAGRRKARSDARPWAASDARTQNTRRVTGETTRLEQVDIDQWGLVRAIVQASVRSPTLP